MPSVTSPDFLSMEAIHQLPKSDAALVLLYLDDLSYREMADVLGISREAVYSRLRRAIPAMRAALEADTRTPTAAPTRQEVAP